MTKLFTRILGISTLFVAASSQLVIPQLVFDQGQHHQGVMQGAADGDFKSGPMLSDQLALDSQASIFFSYARDSAKISTALSGLDDGKYTVFVPTNKAIMALARKPHQGGGSSVEDDIEISEEEADRQRADNVERWVSAHIVPEYLVLSDASTDAAGNHNTLLDDKSITLARDGSRSASDRLVWHLNDGIIIHGERKASNGVMYLIDGTIEV